MTSTTGRADGMGAAFADSQRNYADRRVQPAPPAPPAPTCAEPAPPVLYSVVKYREGEEATLRANLAEPLLAYYAGKQPSLSAVLIERKNASSKDVNVRLFFADGTETSYLWPSTHSQDGMWTPPEMMTP
jgi:hypothetical protein